MTDSASVFWVLYVLLVITTVAGGYLLHDNRKKQADIRHQLDRIADLEGRHRRATQRIAYLTKFQDRLVQGVIPLIEKTDWMTGRWGGKFNELVALERQRNAGVDVVRKALWDTTEVKEFLQTQANRGSILAQLSNSLSQQSGVS